MTTKVRGAIQEAGSIRVGAYIPVTRDPITPTSPETSIVTITPIMAVEWLERGGENRPIFQPSVQRYGTAMKNGEWRLTGESIKLDREGKVRDGQHRLWACVDSQTPFTTFVTINITEDAFDVMDSGRVRSNADVLSLHHHENARVLASAVRQSLNWQVMGTPHGVSRFVASKPQILKWVADHPDIHEWVKRGRATTRAGLPGGPGIWSALFYHFSRIDPVEANSFIDQLISGSGLQKGNPILALRNRLMQASVRSENLDLNEIAAVTIKSWNIWRKGDQIQVLVWRRGGAAREDFPKAI